MVTAHLGGRLRGRLLCPPMQEVDPQVRGFSEWAEGTSIVPQVGRAFLTGYRAGLEAPRAVAAVAGLQELPAEFRGFAIEGLGMAAGVRSALSVRNRHQFHEVVLACGERHTYMLYVGLGWALARTPRLTWLRVADLDPLQVPLVLDGYGFHQIFFHTHRVMAEGCRALDLGLWTDREQEVQHIMQGVGRGLWFVRGGSPAGLAEAFRDFPENFHESLWAGAGLAAGYAGGCGSAALQELRDRAGGYVNALQQGAAFAVEARRRAGTQVAHTELAARVLCDRTIEEVHQLTVAATPAATRIDGREGQPYEEWRRGVIVRVEEPVTPSGGRAVPASVPHPAVVLTAAG